VNKLLVTGLGALTGIVSLIAMVRLIAGAGLASAFAWVFLLLAMLPWVAYCTWRARHGRLSARARLAVFALCLAGLISVWLFTLGPVVALFCSLVAFVIIWVHDWPPRRREGDEHFVPIEELTTEEPKTAA
jgi:O-antigen/teichoic acid export membrane protein